MPAKAKAQEAMHRAGASDSEDDLATASTNGARAAGKAKMTKASTAKTGSKRKASSKDARTALKDRTNMQDSDAEDAEEEEDEEAKPKAKRAKTNATTKKGQTAKPSRQLGVIPETQDQREADDVEQSIEDITDDMDVAKAPTPKQTQRFVQRPRSTSVQPAPVRARSTSVQPGYPGPRERSGSVSGTERERRGGDPEMRRKLNDMTKKYESINLKYQNLQEIGKSNADTNFEKLKRASDQKAKDANDLIASLKKEIAEMRKSTTSNNGESQGLQKQLTSLTASNEKLTSESATFKEKLQASQNEAKALEAKLVAARQQMTSMQESKGAASAQNLSRSVAGSDSQKEAKMKENLYSDLTGLIIRNVKRKEGEDEYDCIQTGRNGTLHFHLSVANDSSVSNPKIPTGLSYEEAEFAYEPFLDESRDRELLDILPDYLAEDICFPRNQAAKFYSKIMDNMTKKIVVDE